jgi:hypothetical protein
VARLRGLCLREVPSWIGQTLMAARRRIELWVLFTCDWGSLFEQSAAWL